jgi:hypothetical protein
MDELRFWKYHGTGNDFVLFEDVADQITIGEELARRVCDRRFGIGADGTIRVTKGSAGLPVIGSAPRANVAGPISTVTAETTPSRTSSARC